MRRILSATALAGLAMLHSGPAAAGPDFGYVYTANTEEPGETEVAVWATDRRGKGKGHYAAQDYRLEVERGLTERLQVSGYADFETHHVRGRDDEFPDVNRSLAFSGLSAEFKYQLLNPSNDRFGLALYAEPGWSRIGKVSGEGTREYELELKVIAQKNFLNDRLTWVANLTFEPEWERERKRIAPGSIEPQTEKELAVEFATGLSYRVARHWWLGGEARYHSVYPDWTEGLHRENYAVHAGPSVHFAAHEWSVTATYQPQLFGGPKGPGSSLELHDHEKREFRLKISREF